MDKICLGIAILCTWLNAGLEEKLVYDDIKMLTYQNLKTAVNVSFCVNKDWAEPYFYTVYFTENEATIAVYEKIIEEQLALVEKPE